MHRIIGINYTRKYYMPFSPDDKSQSVPENRIAQASSRTEIQYLLVGMA